MKTESVSHPVKIKNIHFIINPASGKREPILPVLNEVMKDSHIKWDVSITKKAGDGIHLAKKLIEEKVDAIGVYGGDGSVMEVINGMIGSTIPLVILPGGTGNVFATDLRIPKDLKEACLLITQKDATLQAIDVGQFNRRHFILRTSLGFEAEMVKGADRELKNKFGRIAYCIGAMRAMKKLELIRYDIVIDEEKHQVEGLTCIIANSGNVGFGDLSLDQRIDLSDGLLDVIVVKRLHLSLWKYFFNIVFKGAPIHDRQLVRHWQGREIKITSNPPQDIQCDGEMLKYAPIHAKLFPQAVSVLVPKPEVEKKDPQEISRAS